MAKYYKIILLLFIHIVLTYFIGGSQTIESSDVNVTLGSKGLQGYIAYDSPKSPEGYGAGVSFFKLVYFT